MPVETKIVRVGKIVQFTGGFSWSWWHVETLMNWMKEETPDVELFMGFPNNSPYVFKQDHEAEAPEEQVWDSNVEVGKIHRVEVKAGDCYHAYRTMK